MDLENHRKHSFSNRMRSGIPESHTQCPGPFSVLQGQMQPRNTSRSEDAKNIASDLFRTGACISGRQQKWLQCIIQMFSWLMNRDRWISVADCQYLNSEKVFGDFFWESHSNLDRIYLSQGFGNYFWKPWDKESPTKVMRARPQP